MPPSDLVAGGGGGAASAGGGGGAGGARREALQKMCDEKQTSVDEMERALADLRQRRGRVDSEVAKALRALRAHLGSTDRKFVDTQGLWPTPESRLLETKHTMLMSNLVMENGKLRIQLVEQMKFAHAVVVVGGDGTTTTATSELERFYEEKCHLEDSMLNRYRDMLQRFDKFRSILSTSAKVLESIQTSSPTPMDISISKVPLANPLIAPLDENLSQSQTKWLEQEMKRLETNCSNEMAELAMENATLQVRLDVQVKKNQAMLRCNGSTPTLVSPGNEGTSVLSHNPSLTGVNDEESPSMEYLEILEYAKNSMSPVEENAISSCMQSLRLQDAAPESTSISLGVSVISVSALCSKCCGPLVFQKILAHNEEVDTPLKCERCGHFGQLQFKF